jgi:hypothetical protein
MNQIDQFICDSCNKPNPGWLYRTKQFRSPLVPHSQYVIAGWAACDECRALIDACNLEGLSLRASASQADPEQPGDFEYQYRISLKLYPALFANIIGKAERFTAAESAAIAAQDTRV